MGGPVPGPRSGDPRPGSGPSIAPRGSRGGGGRPHRPGRDGPRISSRRSRRERLPRMRRGSARRRTGEGRRRRGRRGTDAARLRNDRMRRTGGTRRRCVRATGRRRRTKCREIRPAGGPGAWPVRRSMPAEPRPPRRRPSTSSALPGYPRSRKNGGRSRSDRSRVVGRRAEIQRRVAEAAYSRLPWSMAYPFHVPQEGHRAVHLMVEEPQEEHRKGMRYLRLYPNARW